MKKEKEKEPEKMEKQETAMVWKKGFVEEKKDDNDSDEVWINESITRLELNNCFNINVRFIVIVII